MVAWEQLTTPAAPQKKELIPAFLIAALFAVALALVPFNGIWNSPSHLAIACVAAFVFAILTFTVKRIRAITAVALTLLAWKMMLAVDQSHLPEALRGLAPHRIHDLSSSLKLLVLRVGTLALPVLITVVLCLSNSQSRRQFCEYFRFGDWNVGIRWPLPWWGVPPMPIWFFFLVGAPFAIPAFFPVIDWDATRERWNELAVSVILLIPVLAFVNAFLEEMVFRIGILPLLASSLSIEAATIPAAIIFGFVHFYGGFPSGLFGASLLSVGGFFLGYFIVAQKGISGAVVWHMLMDIVILSFVLK